MQSTAKNRYFWKTTEEIPRPVAPSVISTNRQMCAIQGPEGLLSLLLLHYQPQQLRGGQGQRTRKKKPRSWDGSKCQVRKTGDKSQGVGATG